ncbi:MAG: UvrD-helicase domain-containing protein [Actinobacteria bacterium]|nr:UvrD-helicase domain-containing protein [Actinomycetota bacterium]
MTMTGRHGGGEAPPRPPDREQRELILRELDRNIIVEAAAGTGKTTSMTGRMLVLLESGRCRDIRCMAAVTFTRKAAAELRGRFQVELERRVREAEGEEGKRLKAALDRVEQCFIGTIHSFCARLLRERPVEAGVSLDFEELDEEADVRLREEAWHIFVAELAAGDRGGLLERLARLGLNVSDLGSSFADFCLYPDVEEWPTPRKSSEPDLGEAREKLFRYVERLRALEPRLPREVGKDTLIPRMRRLLRVVSHLDDPERSDRLVEALELFDYKPNQVQRVWTATGHFTREEAIAEKNRWIDLRDQVALPALRAWREYRYPTVLEVFRKARRVYDHLRRERGFLNFQDLLMKAAALLRDHPEARRYFQSRFTHLLVDEFQDTDPIQAEVIFFLAAEDPEERDWRACVPRPGSLFLVGDPKQSIYRFRRADIATYAQAKRILVERGGLAVNLQTNFRSTPSVIDWVNEVFRPGEPSEDEKGRAMLRFPAVETLQSPLYVPLLPFRREVACELGGIFRLPIPEECEKNETVRAYEPDLLARVIRDFLDRGATVARAGSEPQEEDDPRVRPDDLMIVTRQKRNLGAMAQALQRYDIPHRVTGGQALNEVEELRLLYLCLRAATRPEDPVALVAALRSELFGVSDARLYDFRRAGGRFSFRSEVPAGLDGADGELFTDAFSRLRRYARWLHLLPPASACERIAGDLGLFALAASRPGGNAQAGSLAKSLELLRAAQREGWSVAHAVEYIGRLASREEAHDGAEALPDSRPAVRIMNLHKVKGLEAPVVFLADPCGESDHPTTVHIDRCGERIRGYLAIHQKTSEYSQKLLAHPPGWEELAEREKAFGRAEELRLRYVAATRCGSAAVISQRKNKNAGNPWCYFDTFIPAARDIADPGPKEAPVKPAAAVSPEERAAGVAETSTRLGASLSPTYRVLAAKEYALSRPGGAGMPPPASAAAAAGPARAGEGGDPPEPEGDEGDVPPGRRKSGDPGGSTDAGSGSPESSTSPGDNLEILSDAEGGTQWGEVIHLLLRAAMAEPGADLERLASASLEERELDPALAPQAAALARSVMASDVWRRALDSEKRLMEVPFQIPWEDGGLPAVLRGVIDLAFREADGWVLVDYKTDRLRRDEVRRAGEKYAPQLSLYARAWEAACGEPVSEALIYFTSTGTLARVGVAPAP